MENNKKSNTAAVWIIIIILIIVIAVILYLGYGMSTSSPASTSAGVTTGAPMIPYYTVAATTSPAIGTYLTAANGMTLYVFANDTSGQSTCTGTCSTQWPPYTVSSTVTLTAAPGISGQLGTLTRADGTTQVTYNGAPLYFWHGDTKPGDIAGNGVSSSWTAATP